MHEARDSICNMTADQAPLSKYLVLPANSTVSMNSINKAVCSLPNEKISSLVTELQDQLNTTAVYSLVSCSWVGFGMGWDGLGLGLGLEWISGWDEFRVGTSSGLGWVLSWDGVELRLGWGWEEVGVGLE